MKITKRQLRRIIKEEKARILYEEDPGQDSKDTRGKAVGTPEGYAEAFVKVLTAVSGVEDMESVREEDLPEIAKAIEMLEKQLDKYNQPMGEARRRRNHLRRR